MIIIRITSKIKRLFRHVVHRLIVKYLVRCGGAFHVFPYGELGRYVALMTEDQWRAYGPIRVGASRQYVTTGLAERAAQALTKEPPGECES